MSVPVCWGSRGQKSVTLSTTEAEYVACSEVVKEVLFILQLLRHLRVEVQLPICVHVDNIGAIFLAENQNSSDRTKHVDRRYHFVRQYIRDKTVMIEFVRSHDNNSDIFTKSTTRKIHHRHSEYKERNGVKRGDSLNTILASTCDSLENSWFTTTKLFMKRNCWLDFLQKIAERRE